MNAGPGRAVRTAPAGCTLHTSVSVPLLSQSVSSLGNARTPPPVHTCKDVFSTVGTRLQRLHTLAAALPAPQSSTESWTRSRPVPDIVHSTEPVSYTHLDVYKRQAEGRQPMEIYTRMKANIFWAYMVTIVILIRQWLNGAINVDKEENPLNIWPVPILHVSQHQIKM